MKPILLPASGHAARRQTPSGTDAARPRSPEQNQPRPCTDAGSGAWFREFWHRLRQTPPWTLSVDCFNHHQCSLTLSHKKRGQVRAWRGQHARLILTHADLKSLLRGRRQRHVQQHQVAYLLMIAAAMELLLKRLRAPAQSAVCSRIQQQHNRHSLFTPLSLASAYNDTGISSHEF